MIFLGIGLIMMFWKFSEVGTPPEWSTRDWMIVGIPFGLAMIWWAWADMTGYTKRKAMERENIKKQKRIDLNKEAIGTLKRKNRR